jgi:Tfp pilus assembly protein PilW
VKKRNIEGSSLLEIIIAIAVLAAVVIPVCSSLVLSHKVNAKTQQMLQAQLEVSAAAEALTARGIPSIIVETTPEGEDYIPVENIEEDVPEAETPSAETESANIEEVQTDPFPNVTVRIYGIEKEGEDILYYNVSFTSTRDPSVMVTTVIRAV